MSETENLTFNQFQQELNKRGIDRANAYMLTMLYERQVETSRQLDMCANLLTELTSIIESFANLNEQTQQQIKMLQKERRPDGIDVRSVANEPE